MQFNRGKKFSDHLKLIYKNVFMYIF